MFQRTTNRHWDFLVLTKYYCFYWLRNNAWWRARETVSSLWSWCRYWLWHMCENGLIIATPREIYARTRMYSPLSKRWLESAFSGRCGITSVLKAPFDMNKWYTYWVENVTPHVEWYVQGRHIIMFCQLFPRCADESCLRNMFCLWSPSNYRTSTPRRWCPWVQRRNYVLNIVCLCRNKNHQSHHQVGWNNCCLVSDYFSFCCGIYYFSCYYFFINFVCFVSILVILPFFIDIERCFCVGYILFICFCTMRRTVIIFVGNYCLLISTLRVSHMSVKSLSSPCVSRSKVCSCFSARVFNSWLMSRQISWFTPWRL